MPDERPPQSILACPGRVVLAATAVLMAALLAEMILSLSDDFPARAGLTLIAALSLCSAVLGILCFGRCVLPPPVSAGMGLLLFVLSAAGLFGFAGRHGVLAASVLTLLAACFAGAALERALEVRRRKWVLAAAVCAIQMLFYFVPPFAGVIRSGALARVAFVVPVPEETALAGQYTDAQLSAFGLNPLDTVLLAAFIWAGPGGGKGTRGAVAAALGAGLLVALLTMVLGVPVPVLPFLAALVCVIESARRKPLVDASVEAPVDAPVSAGGEPLD